MTKYSVGQKVWYVSNPYDKPYVKYGEKIRRTKGFIFGVGKKSVDIALSSSHTVSTGLDSVEPRYED